MIFQLVWNENFKIRNFFGLKFLNDWFDNNYIIHDIFKYRGILVRKYKNLKCFNQKG